MLTPALVVARGGVIHRDIFSQYGPITAYLQAVFVWIFGPHLLSIRIASATYLSLAIALLYSSWRRVFGEGIALFAY
ncbi:MAG: glycosyltransferase family 39 protein, partial [Gammaproteobacteria bacterium]